MNYIKITQGDDLSFYISYLLVLLLYKPCVKLLMATFRDSVPHIVILPGLKKPNLIDNVNLAGIDFKITGVKGDPVTDHSFMTAGHDCPEEYRNMLSLALSNQLAITHLRLNNVHSQSRIPQLSAETSVAVRFSQRLKM